MNKLLVVFALLAVVGSAVCDSSEEVLDTVKSKHLRKYLASNKDHLDDGLEKIEKHCPGVGAKIKQAIIEFNECDNKTDDSLTICEQIKKDGYTCAKPILKVVDDCLPEKAKGLPDLGVKSLISVVEHLCKQTGETLIELANPCLYEDVEGENEELEKCEEKITSHIEKYNENKDKIPSKTEVCNAATSLRSCIELRNNLSCKNAKTKQAALGVFDALVAPCSHINEV